jgi:hypothetical protein
VPVEEAMTLPVSPEVDTILASCIQTLRDVVVPEVDSEWGRYSAELLVGSLEYARQLLRGDANAARREALGRAIDGLRGSVQDSGSEAWRSALSDPSPFVVASSLLVQAQNDPGQLADAVRDALHPILKAQLDAEFNRALPLFAAFARNMAGSR